MIKNFDDYLFESYGSNKLVEGLSEYIFNIINSNIGKILLNKEIEFNNILKKYKDDNYELSFKDDKINIKISNRNYGNINPKSIEIIGDTIINLNLNLELNINEAEFKLKKLFKSNKIYTTINHEILHLVELYITKRKETKISNSWNYGEKLSFLNKKYNSEYWNDISYFIYLSFPHEQRARIQELNADIYSKNIKGVTNTIEYIKNSKIYKDISFLSNLDSYFILNKLKKDRNYLNIIKDFNFIFLEKKNTYLNEQENEFIRYFNSLIRRNKKILNKLLRISYNFESFESFSYEFINKEIDYKLWIKD